MAKRTPAIRFNDFHATLQVWRNSPMLGQYRDDYRLDSEEWFLWLNLTDSQSFRFEPINNAQTTFTARREKRGNENYWYGYKKVIGKLHKLYIGRSFELTLKRLEVIATTFANIHTDSSAKNQRQKCLTISKAELETIGNVLIADPIITRQGKDKGSVRRAITAFIEKLFESQ